MMAQSASRARQGLLAHDLLEDLERGGRLVEWHLVTGTVHTQEIEIVLRFEGACSLAVDVVWGKCLGHEAGLTGERDSFGGSLTTEPIALQANQSVLCL